MSEGIHSLQRWWKKMKKEKNKETKINTKQNQGKSANLTNTERSFRYVLDRANFENLGSMSRSKGRFWFMQPLQTSAACSEWSWLVLMAVQPIFKPNCSHRNYKLLNPLHFLHPLHVANSFSGCTNENTLFVVLGRKSGVWKESYCKDFYTYLLFYLWTRFFFLRICKWF